MTTVLYLFRVLRRRAWLATVLFVLFALGGVAAAYVKKPVFEASAKLLLNTEALPLSLSRAELPQMGVNGPTIETISTLIEILTARDLTEELVDDLGPDAFKAPPPSNPVVRTVMEWVSSVTGGVSDQLARLGLIQKLSPRDDLVEAVRKRLVVYPVRQSQVLEVALTWPTPQVPKMATARLLDLFLARIDKLNALSSEQSLFSKQADQAAKDLAGSQTTLRALQRQNGVVNPTLEIQRLTERIARNEQALAAPDSAATTDNGASPAEGSRIDDLLRRISALQIDLAGAQALNTPESAAVREVLARLKAAEAALNQETSRIASSLAEDKARLEGLLGIEDQFIAANKAVDAAAEALRAYRQAAADRQLMALQQEHVRIRVIDAPATPLQAKGPSRLILVVVALIGAAVLSATFTLLINRLSEDLAQSGKGQTREGAGNPEPGETVPGVQTETVGSRPVLAVGGGRASS